MWIPVHDTLIHHRKVFALMELTGWSRMETIGRIVTLWTWALVNRPDGDLSRTPDVVLTIVMDLPLAPEAATGVVFSLIRAGFLSKSRRIHDWEHYAGYFSKNRERQRRYREKQRTKNERGGVTGDVTGNVTSSSPFNSLSTSTDRNGVGGTGGEGRREGVGTPVPVLDGLWREFQAAHGYAASRDQFDTEVHRLLSAGVARGILVLCWQEHPGVDILDVARMVLGGNGQKQKPAPPKARKDCPDCRGSGHRPVTVERDGRKYEAVENCPCRSPATTGREERP